MASIKTMQNTFNGMSSLKELVTPNTISSSVNVPLSKTLYDNSFNPYSNLNSSVPTSAILKLAYVVTFEAENNTEATRKILYYDSITYGDLPEPEKEGFIFDGWYTEENGSGNKIESTTQFNLASDITLYASWNED